MIAPYLFAAPRAGGDLYRLDAGNVDAGLTPINFLLQTEAMAPGGMGGEAIFYALIVGLTHSAALAWTLRITPIVGQHDYATRVTSAVEKAPIDLTIAASAGSRATVTIPVDLSEGYERGGVVRFRSPFRGEWLALRLESIGGIPTGDILLTRLGVEREIVVDNRSKVNPA